MSKSFPRFGMLSAIVSLHKLSNLLSLYSGTPVTLVYVPLIMSHRLDRLFCLFVRFAYSSLFFLCFPTTRLFRIPIFWLNDSVFFLVCSHLMLSCCIYVCMYVCMYLFVYLFIYYLYFIHCILNLQNFYLAILYDFCIFDEFLILLMKCSSDFIELSFCLFL